MTATPLLRDWMYRSRAESHSYVCLCQVLSKVKQVLIEFGFSSWHRGNIDGLMQERRNSIANALELRPSCTNPSLWCKANEQSWWFYWWGGTYFGNCSWTSKIKLMCLSHHDIKTPKHQVDGLVQERRNSSALAMELRLSCTKPSRWLLRHQLGSISWYPEKCYWPTWWVTKPLLQPMVIYFQQYPLKTHQHVIFLRKCFWN